MKFSQLKNTTWEIFFSKNHNAVYIQNVMDKLVPETFLWKIYIEHISGSTVWNFMVCLEICSGWGADHSLLPHIKLLKKERSQISLSYFQHDFWRKIFLLCFTNWPNFIVWLSLLLEMLSNMCIIICFPVYHIINFEINCSFLIKPFF